MHWADVLARELHDRGSRHVLATAITPSGPIHVGNMREVLTTEAVHRSVLRLGDDAELIYIGDTYDPLRKVYPFLDASMYREHVGKPLSEIPCPGECHASYAHHFLDPFLKDLEELGVRPRVLLAHEMYEKGMYLDATKDSLDGTQAIREIMVRIAKREGKLPDNWIPFNVQCASCRRLNGPVPTLYEYPFIEYECKACNFTGRKDVREPGGGKLPWRVDWPARWKFLEVTFEAMGKDHAAAGSSWDTGIEISENVFGYPPPLRTVYEFVQVKGVGAMHSSTGTAVSASEMLKMTPPEVLRFLFVKNQPGRHIDFDTGKWIVDLVNDYDRWEDAYWSKDPELRERPEFAELDRVHELSQPSGKVGEEPPDVPYNHLVLLTELFGEWPRVKDKLRASELIGDLTPTQEQLLRKRVEHARFWLDRFAPADARTEVQRDFSAALVTDLDPLQKRLLAEVAKRLKNGSWGAERVHNAIHETAAALNVPGPKAFAAIYAAFLGKTRGPRAGYLLASLDREFVLRRLADASAA